MVITLNGNIPVKKNSKEIIYVRGKPIIISNKVHREWHKQALLQLMAQRLKPIHGPVKIQVDCQLANKRKKDLDGVLSTLLDLLVDAHLIDDDNHTIVQYAAIRFMGYGDTTLISIYEQT